jgi:hypothetical protein
MNKNWVIKIMQKSYHDNFFIKLCKKSISKNYDGNIVMQNVIHTSIVYNFVSFLEIMMISFDPQNIIHKTYEHKFVTF